MKKIIFSLALISALYSCKSIQQNEAVTVDDSIFVRLDLVNVQDDKVKVSIDPGKFTSPETTFYIPKTVPGTYSSDNYGKFIENFKALDYQGNELKFSKIDDNTWTISDALNLDKITYYVNDTFDIDGEEGVFSPSGTNISKNENFVLNLHGFVGYFKGQNEESYKLEIVRPNTLIAGTALEFTGSKESAEKSAVVDNFYAKRYFEITDNPIMYAAPDTTAFKVDNMDVLINVYSPNKKFTSKDIKPGIEEMITAQKKFLGEIDNTDKYAILLYLSDIQKLDARGFGALEHHTSTTVVFPESIPPSALSKAMVDVVSHEFFHILTPLSVHSKEIHFFDYNDPKMSQHLWMYEGVTEYFANLFQINQGLISAEDYYGRVSDQIKASYNYDDSMPFTLMSQNILEDKYQANYANVYQKGALIGMALDIRLRELSNGEMGLLDVMKKLSTKYGKDTPFEDDNLFSEIVSLSYPEIQDFFDTYVSGSTPIPYTDFLSKVGLELTEQQVNTGYFIYGQVPYIDGDPATGALFFREGITYNSFLNDLEVQGGDIIKTVDGSEYTINNVYNLIMTAESWPEGKDVKFVIDRDGEEMVLEAKTAQPTESEKKISEMDLAPDSPEVKLREAWLKN